MHENYLSAQGLQNNPKKSIHNMNIVSQKTHRPLSGLQVLSSMDILKAQSRYIPLTKDIESASTTHHSLSIQNSTILRKDACNKKPSSATPSTKNNILNWIPEAKIGSNAQPSSTRLRVVVGRQKPYVINF